jgi:CelD/BcsL family acetyltransferase involved in cellulose biosynthesis
MIPAHVHLPFQEITDTFDGVMLRVSGATPESFARLAEVETSATPFQSASWIEAFLGSHDTSTDFRLIEITDQRGSTLLPLLLFRRAGVTLAGKIGGAHASYFAPACIGDPCAVPHAPLAQMLGKAGHMAGIDAFLLADCPENWGTSGNALMQLPHQPSPSDGAGLTLDADGETVLARLSDRDDRKKLRQKSTKLAAFGPLTTGWVEAADIPAALEQYYDWKARQFAAMGIADPFSEPTMRRFLATATVGGDAPIRLFQLKAGERPLALLGGAQAGGSFTGKQFSGMFTAYDPVPDVARYSPGEVLIAALIPALCRESFAHFDLGVGEARYKAHYGPERITLLDIALPVTVLGRMACASWLLARKAKRAIKQNGAVFDGLKRFRRFYAGN